MSKGSWAHQAIEYLHETGAAFEQCEQSIRVNLTKTAPKQLELRYAATLVFPRRIRAVLLLCEEHLAHEADAIVRGLLELGFTLHWADSEDKARRVANKAATASESLMIGAKKAGYEVSQEDVADASARVDGGLTGLPNMRQLAESSDLQGVYLVS